jgi:Transposase DDE domain group 1
MSVAIGLEDVVNQCSYVPLAVLGYCLTKSKLLDPAWKPIKMPIKTVAHAPTAKLQDVLVAIMAGCQSLGQVNTKLRPELALARAWQRQRFAEQSTLSRMLDALNDVQIEQLRAANMELLRQHSQLLGHDWRHSVVLDIDPTSLITSKRAQGSRKGWVSAGRNYYCRHVIRFTVAGYHESLLSLTYPGNKHGYQYCKPALKRLRALWPMLANHAGQLIIRSDAEQGTDTNISYILWCGFQLLVKGYSGNRTKSWLSQLPANAWSVDPGNQERWMALSPQQLHLGRHTDSYLLRWLGAKGQPAHATLHTTLRLPYFQLWHLYNQRALTEIEIRGDKSGLKLHLRRKHSLSAQEAWVVLTDMAHNLLAWLTPWMLTDSAFAGFGPKRIVDELLNIPGHIVIENGRLQRVTLWRSHPYASEMRLCIANLLKTFDLH